MLRLDLESIFSMLDMIQIKISNERTFTHVPLRPRQEICQTLMNACRFDRKIVKKFRQKMDPVGRVISACQRAEEQLQHETEKLNKEIIAREEESKRAQALYNLFEQKRFVDDIKNGRVSHPPVFYEAWNGNIGKLTHYLKGADEGALAQMFESYQNTLKMRAESHRKDLISVLK